jgi:hypothetical protein
MARNDRTPAEVRGDIANEREQLADAVDELRKGIGEVADVSGKLRANLPLVGAGALGVGFFLAGGVGATMRWLARRGREGREKARVGPFSFVKRR